MNSFVIVTFQIKYLKIVLPLLLVLLAVQCSETTMHTNDIALELTKLEGEGIIRQSDRKDAIFLFFEEKLIDQFTKMGFGHRINEIKENWGVYEDKGYVIFTGSVAKTDDEIYIFTQVYKDEGEGKFTPIYVQVGQEKNGNYPKNIIPNSK